MISWRIRRKHYHVCHYQTQFYSIDTVCLRQVRRGGIIYNLADLSHLELGLQTFERVIIMAAVYFGDGTPALGGGVVAAHEEY